MLVRKTEEKNKKEKLVHLYTGPEAQTHWCQHSKSRQELCASGHEPKSERKQQAHVSCFRFLDAAMLPSDKSASSCFLLEGCGLRYERT